MRNNILLCLIIILAASLRLYGINWDSGFSLHPDERAIVMFTTSLHFPKTITEFFSSQSPWNPHFFAYGSFPLYLLKIAGDVAGIFNPILVLYGGINLVGRVLSAFFDIATLGMVFLFGKKLFNKKVGLLSTFFYAISVLPIQLSHFFAVDTPLTFFVMLTLWFLIHLYQQPSKKYALLTGIFWGLALATKASASVLLVSIGMATAIDFLFIFLKQPNKPHLWFPHLPKFLRRLLVDGVIIAFIATTIFIIFEPYALIDFQTFLLHNLQQQHMTYDAFTFPYTLQYVGKIPYWYELKNIFSFGLGPILASLAFLGTLYITYTSIKNKDKKIIIVLTFFAVYFLIVGKFAIGFMRYMLPLYPLMSLFAAVFFYFLLNKLYPIRYFLYALLLTVLVWPLMFMSIYTNPNTRVVASEWINRNIETGKTIAIEHWDDSLPLYGQQNYRIVTLPLYDPDTQNKWEMINTKLNNTDYIIIASNRLYVPLQKLTDCKNLPFGRCYPLTAEYYKKLFNGTLGFKKVAEFSAYPNSSLFTLHFSLNDSSADESFTVYDHPKVMIFKKEL